MATYIIQWHVTRAGMPSMGGVTTAHEKTQAQLDKVLDQLKAAFPDWASIEAGYTN